MEGWLWLKAYKLLTNSTDLFVNVILVQIFKISTTVGGSRTLHDGAWNFYWPTQTEIPSNFPSTHKVVGFCVKSLHFTFSHLEEFSKLSVNVLYNQRHLIWQPKLPCDRMLNWMNLQHTFLNYQEVNWFTVFEQRHVKNVPNQMLELRRSRVQRQWTQTRGMFGHGSNSHPWRWFGM